jgi:hypothetical protein
MSPLVDLLKEPQRHFVLDVEADGPCPGLYNMISFGLVSLADPSDSFLGEVSMAFPERSLPEARAISGVTIEQQMTFRSYMLVMRDAEQWILNRTDKTTAVFWSDNPAFDWQFWNWYCSVALDSNPAGYSMRRIGDLYAGEQLNPRDHNSWKKKRKTAHTHNPVDDARGNAEALTDILTRIARKRDNERHQQ